MISFSSSVWRSQIQTLICTFGIIHHTVNVVTLIYELENGDDVVLNKNYPVWVKIDGLLTTWLLNTMTIDVSCFTFGMNAIYQVCKTMEEHLLCKPQIRKKILLLTI